MDKSLKGPKVSIQKPFISGPFTSLGIENKEQSLKIHAHASIRSHTVIYGGSTIGSYFTTGHGVLIRENCNIGNHVSIGSHSVIEHHVRIGNNVRIHSNAFIPEYSVLEDDVWIGPHVVLTNAKYPKSKNVKKELKGVQIKTNAKIGANVTLLPGVIIGKHALIGAGSVVVKNVSDNEVVAGNPAQVINNIKKLPYV